MQSIVLLKYRNHSFLVFLSVRLVLGIGHLADVGGVDVKNCRDLLVGRSLKNFCFLTFSLL